MTSPDPLADSFLDRLMAERREAENIAAEREGQAASEAVSTVEDRFTEITDQPVPKSALFRAIEEKGELTEDDLHKLVAREVKRGI